MLFFWKTERVVSHSVFNPDDATPRFNEDNEIANGYTIFRLFRLDLHVKRGSEYEKAEPEEIKDRMIKIPDENGKIALSIGFLRSMTEKAYHSKVSVFFTYHQMIPWLDDQLVQIKYVNLKDDKDA